MWTWLKILFGRLDRRLSSEEDIEIFNTTLNVIRTGILIALLVLMIVK